MQGNQVKLRDKGRHAMPCRAWLPWKCEPFQRSLEEQSSEFAKICEDDVIREKQMLSREAFLLGNPSVPSIMFQVCELSRFLVF